MKRVIAIILIAALMLTLAGCAGKDIKKLRVGFLKGPTGVGAAKMIDEYSDKYSFTIESDVSVIVSALISGSLDIAAVPTNVASILYNKSEGKLKIIAINTMSVLHILENGNSVADISDLRGKTVYSVGQGANPEYVLSYLLRKSGLEPGKDVFIEFMDATEITTRMISGEISLAILPVPNATTVMMKNPDIRDAVDVGKVWANVCDGVGLAQGCIVAGTDISDADNNISAFLSDYRASIEFITDESNKAVVSELCVKYELIPSVEIAENALSQCGITFITEKSEMSQILGEYFKVLFDADKTSTGGALPDEDIYYCK